MKTSAYVVLVALALNFVGCGSSPMPVSPTLASPPSVTTISPNVGSTGGATRMTITGTGFLSGATVTFGGVAVQGRFDSRYVGTTMYLDTPEHVAGTVDVVVTNPGGQSVRMTDGYTYASPQSFDFNGSWSGFGNAGRDIPILFTIQNNVLISVSCDAYATLTLSPLPSVTNGVFSFVGNDASASQAGSSRPPPRLERSILRLAWPRPGTPRSSSQGLKVPRHPRRVEGLGQESL